MRLRIQFAATLVIRSLMCQLTARAYLLARVRAAAGDMRREVGSVIQLTNAIQSAAWTGNLSSVARCRTPLSLYSRLLPNRPR
jgi:hypothetical protein